MCVTYWLNLLQNLPAECPDTFVTLNPPTPPAEGTVIKRLSLAHPVYSFASVQAQEKLPSVQGVGGVRHTSTPLPLPLRICECYPSPPYGHLHTRSVGTSSCCLSLFHGIV